ncbi:AraC family transcriptional regulator [Paenibacillus terrigena]|uniref:AraC family transcriptional regulator n=1 Tax=Paenibacillus terrigena TaxID=369333 RepID=UPI000368EAF9|nr:AraC family transcriptional regulator [Paenibacillus terrigena]
MFTLLAVHYDDCIPGWNTVREAIPYHVIVLMVEGTATYTINGVTHRVEAGDLLVIPKGTVRAGSNTEAPHRKYTVLFNLIDDANADAQLLLPSHFMRMKISNYEYVLKRFSRLFQERWEGKPYHESICLGILIELLGVAKREPISPAVEPIKFYLARKIHLELQTHYRESIQISELAKLIGRSPNYTIAMFKKALGMTPIEYVHQLRVQEASSLLLESTMSVTEISDYLGFYDTSHFYRVFKKMMKESPSAYITNRKGC